MATLVEEEATPGKGKRRDDTSWADTNLTGSKNKEKSHS
jgi:hypothetical protein